MNHHAHGGQGWKRKAERLAERLGDRERIVELAQAELARGRDRERQWTERLQRAEAAADRANATAAQCVELRAALAEQGIVQRQLQLNLEALRGEYAREHEIADVARRLRSVVDEFYEVTSPDYRAGEVEDTTHTAGDAGDGRTAP